jgi:hypothetical protein
MDIKIIKKISNLEKQKYKHKQKQFCNKIPNVFELINKFGIWCKHKIVSKKHFFYKLKMKKKSLKKKESYN